MTPHEADTPTPETGASGAGPDPLDELAQRVRAAQEAAERIAAEAVAGAAAGRERAEGPPPGAHAGPQPGGSDGRRTAEAQALVALLELGRGLVPPELRRALADLVRELLLLVRALIDWYLERAELRRRGPAEVEDIPIS